MTSAQFINIFTKVVLAGFLAVSLFLPGRAIFAEGEGDAPPPPAEEVITPADPEPPLGESSTPTEDPILPPTEEASSSEEESSTSPEEGSLTTSDNLSEESTNEAQPPGESGGGGEIQTGNAYAAASVLNVVNTNIVDSDGFFAFMNFLYPYTGSFSLANLESLREKCGAGCDGNFREGRDLSITNQNEATIVNDITVSADTGHNTATGEASVIRTGNAYAAANVVNVVNTNIIRSQYMLLAINSMSGWLGDIVLPGWEFFQNFFNLSPARNTNLTLSNENTATVENEANVSAETGENIAGGESGIYTGNANAITNVLNMVNQNHTQSAPVYVMVRVLGDWVGNLFGLPPGLSWERTRDGLVIYSDYLGGSAGCCGNSLSISNQNTANIQNRVNVYAMTGMNEAGPRSSIETGSARAFANIVNMANTNIVSQNWLTAMITIGGNWNGNLTFGKPDLWIGERVTVTQNPLQHGGNAHFTVTVKNNGTAGASNVRVQSRFGRTGVMYISHPGGSISSPEGAEWTIPYIAPGAVETFNFTATVEHLLSGSEQVLPVSLSVEGEEEDANPNDNRDYLSLTVNPFSGSGNPHANQLTLRKNSYPQSRAEKGSRVEYEVVLRNFNFQSSIYNVVVTDELVDPTGKVVASNSWDLGEVYASEEVFIEYDVQFGTNIPEGIYRNNAEVRAVSSNGQELPPVRVSDEIVIGSPNPSLVVLNPYKDPNDLPVFPVAETSEGISLSSPELERRLVLEDQLGKRGIVLGEATSSTSTAPSFGPYPPSFTKYSPEDSLLFGPRIAFPNMPAGTYLAFAADYGLGSARVPLSKTLEEIFPGGKWGIFSTILSLMLLLAALRQTSEQVNSRGGYICFYSSPYKDEDE